MFEFKKHVHTLTHIEAKSGPRADPEKLANLHFESSNAVVCDVLAPGAAPAGAKGGEGLGEFSSNKINAPFAPCVAPAGAVGEERDLEFATTSDDELPAQALPKKMNLIVAFFFRQRIFRSVKFRVQSFWPLEVLMGAACSKQSLARDRIRFSICGA